VRRACVACHTGKTRCSEVLPCQVRLAIVALIIGLNLSRVVSSAVLARLVLIQILRLKIITLTIIQPVRSQLCPRILVLMPAAAATATSVQFAAPPIYAPNLHGTPALSQQYYDYNGTFTGASSSTFRPNKRQRALTEEEAAAITRNFSRGDFFVGSSQPVRIDPRLTVRLALGEGDNVHFYVGEPLI
jgi:hypothetical protein